MAGKSTNEPPKKRLDFDGPFQERVVRLLFQEPGFAANALAYIDKDHFENPVHRWVVGKMAWCQENYGHPLSRAILRREREKAIGFKIIKPEEARAYRRFCKRIGNPVPDKSYIKSELQTFVKEQVTKQVILDVVENDLPQHKLSSIDKKLLSITDINITVDNSMGVRPGERWKKRIRRREKFQLNGISTGIDALDRCLRPEGVPPKRLAALMARTGEGKSMWLVHLAKVAALLGIPTVYVSLELDTEEIEDRLDAAFTEVPLNLLKAKPDTVSARWKKIQDRVTRSLILKEFPPGSLTIPGLRAYLKSLERHAFYPKLVLVDPLDNAKPIVEYRDDSYQTYGQLWTDARGLACEMNFAMWTVVQPNRDAYKRESKGTVKLADTGLSMQKTHISDFWGVLSQNEAEKKRKRVRFGIEKNRMGPAGREFLLEVDYGRMSFKDVRTY